MINKPFSKDKAMEQNKEVQGAKKLTLKKVVKGIFAAGLIIGGTLFAIDHKGCRTTTVNFLKGIKFPWKDSADSVADELPKTEPTQAKEYRQNYNNRRDGYQQNRRPQWNNN